jgi:hypothetical protein
MNWKDSYIWNFTKDSKWVLDKGTPGNFNFTPTPNKYRYNEGHLISSIEDQVPILEFTGVPISTDHAPCEYWFKYPVWNTVYYLTSKPYDIFYLENLDINSKVIISGIYKAQLQSTGYGFESLTNTKNITSGIFKVSIYTYEYNENLTSIQEIVSGIYKNVVHNTAYIESINMTYGNIYSGIYKKALITTEIPYESLHLNLRVIVGGVYAHT